MARSKRLELHPMVVFGLIGLMWAGMELQRAQCFARGNQACPSALEYILPGDQELEKPFKTPKARVSQKETSPTVLESAKNTVGDEKDLKR